jgi:hypothetical protein
MKGCLKYFLELLTEQRLVERVVASRKLDVRLMKLCFPTRLLYLHQHKDVRAARNVNQIRAEHPADDWTDDS